MKNKQTTLNLKASQAIASLGIECESEKWWCERDGRSWLITFNEFEDFKNSISFISTVDVCFAPSLQELLALLPAIGEKLGWNEEDPEIERVCVLEGNCHINYAHNLLDTYLSHGMEGCSREIIRIIKEK